MNQTAFAFALPALAAATAGFVPAAPSTRPLCAPDADPGEAIGFDHARWALVPPADCLWPGHPVREGWERGRRLLGRRTREATLAVRRWLALRLAAWRAGEAFDDHQITPHALRALESSTQCPVSGAAFDAGTAPGQHAAAAGATSEGVVMRVDAARGWVAGNLVLLAPAIAAFWDEVDAVAAEAQWLAAREALDARRPLPRGLAPATWARVRALKSLATPLPHDTARALPLLVLPPNRLRLANPIQALQALITLQLAAPGWGARAGRVAESLPEPLRADFHLFFHTLLARALQQGHGAERARMRSALELAWGHAEVQRRWQRFAAAINPDMARCLAERLARQGLPGLAFVAHGDGVAVDA